MKQAKPRVLPLCGERHYIALMRTKPCAVWQNLMVHVIVNPVVNPVFEHAHVEHEPTVHTLQSAQLQTGVPAMQAHIGMVVPKKVFPLAVDRNKVRRLARAHMQQLTQQLFGQSTNHNINQEPNTVQQLHCLIRFKAVKKAAAKQATKPANTQPLTAVNSQTLNPHTAQFSQAFYQTLAQALSKANTHKTTV